MVHEIFFATTIIIGLSKNEPIKKATGFFFTNDGNTLYLVTNKHVIYGKDFERKPTPQIDKIKINLHVNVHDLQQNEQVVIDLFEDTAQMWLEHSDPSVDLVLVPVNLDRARYVLTAIDTSYLEQQQTEHTLVYFEKIFVMGYPHGWYDTKNNLPITRVGNLSSPYGIHFRGYNYMLGDVETLPGMSGSPVLMDLKNYTVQQENGTLINYPGRRKFLLVGVNSGQPIIPEAPEGTRPNLISIWFPDLILEIIAAHKS